MTGAYQSADQLEKFDRSLGGSIIAHSLPVELLAELGTAGVAVVTALLWITWRRLREVRRGGAGRATPTAGPGADPLACYADAVIASTIACLVTGAFLSLLYFPYLWLLISLGSGIYQTYLARAATQPGGKI
jgi:hypothetical protein